jgi:hypothetical protein
MQNILQLFSRWMANTMPQLIAAGSAGGTAITIRLSDLSMKVLTSDLFIMSIGQIAQKPSTAIIAIIATNFIPSS